METLKTVKKVTVIVNDDEGVEYEADVVEIDTSEDGKELVIIIKKELV